MAELNKTNEAKKVAAALQDILFNIDFTAGACGATEMISAILPTQCLDNAKEALEKFHGIADGSSSEG